MEDITPFKKEEIKKLINQYSKKGFEYGKSLKYLCFRNKCKKEIFENDLLNLEKLNSVFKQFKKGEERYLLYFIYSNRRGRAYVIKFTEKIRIITAFPLGLRTLKKYNKTKFKYPKTL